MKGTSPLREMTLCLGARALGDGVEISQIGKVAARRGVLWRNRLTDGVVFLFCRCGALDVAPLAGADARVRAGEVLVLFPGRRVTLSPAAAETQFAYVELKGLQAVRAVLRLGYWDGFHAEDGGGAEFLDALAARLEGSLLRGRDGQLLAVLEQNLNAVWRNCRSRAPSPEAFVALRAVGNLPPGELTTEKTAEALGMSRSKLNALFLSGVGRRPGAYLAALKCAVAGELLSDAALPVTRIAQRMGFSSASAFACFFRRHCGMTPGAWRRLQGGGACA